MRASDRFPMTIVKRTSREANKVTRANMPRRFFFASGKRRKIGLDRTGGSNFVLRWIKIKGGKEYHSRAEIIFSFYCGREGFVKVYSVKSGRHIALPLRFREERNEGRGYKGTILYHLLPVIYFFDTFKRS